MNPRLVKFAVELQNGVKEEKEHEYIHFSNGGKKDLFGLLKPVKVTVPINRE